MQVNEDEKRLIAQAIALKRRVVRLRQELERALKTSPEGGRLRPRHRVDGKPLDPATLPALAREKYLLYQEAVQELNQLRFQVSPELRNLIDPQIAC